MLEGPRYLSKVQQVGGERVREKEASTPPRGRSFCVWTRSGSGRESSWGCAVLIYPPTPRSRFAPGDVYPQERSGLCLVGWVWQESASGAAPEGSLSWGERLP